MSGVEEEVCGALGRRGMVRTLPMAVLRGLVSVRP